jgi:hypothetical protein
MTVTFDLSLFSNTGDLAVYIPMNIGWVAMVTGFSLVLYSRLYLVNTSPKVLRIVLFAIIADGFIVHVPEIVSSYVPDRSKVYQITSSLEIIFTVQEVVLSSLYIYFFRRFVRQGESDESPYIWRTFLSLIAAEVLILFGDIALTASLYLELFLARRIFFTFVYVVKLMVEFFVLNRLVNIGRLRQEQAHNLGGESNGVGDTSGTQHHSTPVEQIRTLLCLRSANIKSHIHSSDALPPMSTVKGGKNLSASPGQGSSSTSLHSYRFTETQQGTRSSMDETERRYLGRLGTDFEV